MITVLYGPPYPATGEPFEAVAPAPPGYPMLRATGTTDQEAAAAFESMWRARPDADPDDELEFIRCVRVRATIVLILGTGWQARANPGTGSDLAVTASDRAAVENDFVAAWNSARGTDFAHDDFAFDRIG